MPLQGAIVCWTVTTNFWGVGVVPLQGATVVCYGVTRNFGGGCHCSVLWFGGEGDDQLWRSGRGAIAGCHCSLLWFGGRVTTNFGGVDGGRCGCHCRVPLQGAIVVRYGWGGHFFFTLITFDNAKICFLLSGVYAGIILCTFVTVDLLL